MTQGAAERTKPTGTIALLTDFGLQDPFVGVMKASIVRHFPDAQLLDLSHGIPPQDLVAAAFWLDRCFTWYPAGTVHLAVIDPAVGSSRQALAAYGAGHYFVLPDNGILPPRIVASPDFQVVALDPEQLGLTPVSSTFHGRDVFGPVAAMVARGTGDLEALGTPAQQMAERALPLAKQKGDRILGKVCVIDYYGNLITNLDRDLLPASGEVVARAGGEELPLCRTYSDVEEGELAAIFGSFGTLEIAQRNGNASTALALGPGSTVELIAKPSTER